MIEIESIEAGVKREFHGDVHICGDVGLNAEIVVTEGDLIIDGNIADEAKISVSPKRVEGKRAINPTY